ncbi:MAG: response regulator [Rhizobiales bacterium]|nr:response regulator [Hyphomicrobiales bacterium]
MDLSGKRILIVEDELLVALSLEESLRAQGGTVIGPAGTLAEARHLAQDVEADVAILDVNLRGEPVFEAAEILMERGIPLIFCSGMVGSAPLPPAFASARQVPKPYTGAVIVDAVRRALDGPSPAPANRPAREPAHI